MTDVNQKFVYSSNYTDKTSNLIMTDVNQKFVYSSNYTDKTSNLIMTDVNQKFIDTSNYVDKTSNLIMTDVNERINTAQSQITGGASTITNDNLTPNKVLISNGEGKVATSNNIDLVKLGYLDDVINPIGSSISGLQTSKQDTISASPTSIITINNNILNTEWKKQGTDTIFYDGYVNITSNLHCSNLYCSNLYCSNLETYKSKVLNELQVCDTTLKITNQSIKAQGKIEFSNPNYIDEYNTINLYFNRLTKRVVFDKNSEGNKVAKELISNNTYNYNQNYIDYVDNVYAGHIQNGTGTLYIYDKNISTYPLDTESFSVSFWFYVPNGIPTPAPGFSHTCRILNIDQDKFNLLQKDRPRLRLLVLRQHGAGIIASAIILQGNSIDGGASGNTDWVNLISYNGPSFNDFSVPMFITVSAWIDSTKIVSTIYINGVLIATTQLPKLETEWRLENFYFTDSKLETGSFIPFQRFRFWNIYMNYNSYISETEAIALYRFETNTIQNTVEVNGTIRASILSVDKIYLKNSSFSLPSAYNLKSFFSQERGLLKSEHTVTGSLSKNLNLNLNTVKAKR
jgi:hypothetical protein